MISHTARELTAAERIRECEACDGRGYVYEDEHRWSHDSGYYARERVAPCRACGGRYTIFGGEDGTGEIVACCVECGDDATHIVIASADGSEEQLCRACMDAAYDDDEGAAADGGEREVA